MNKTNIEWVKNPDGSQGYTWNPITGCLNHTPEGLCLGGLFPCYAYKLAHGRLRQRYLSGGIFPISSSIHERYPNCMLDPFYPRFWEERLKELHQVKAWTTNQGKTYTIKRFSSQAKGIFVCDMGELFGDWIPRVWQDEIFDCIKANRHHRFYLLTKQPQNLVKWSPFPDNCWVGVTVCNEPMFQKAMKYLPYVQAKIRFISFEPLLGRILTTPGQLKRYINWVIIGAQTKPYKPPKIEWVEEIVKAADQAGIPVFIKNNLLAELPMSIKGKPLLHGAYKLRQEMPERRSHGNKD